MQSTVQLFNTALARLGGDQFQPLISPQEEGNTLGILCENLFPHVLDMALQAHTWGFALRSDSLALKTESPEEERAGRSGFAYRYKLPEDCVRPDALEGGSPNRSPAYVIRGSSEGVRVLLCDENPAILTYVSRVVDPRLWPPLFADALAWGMAAELATGRINDPQRQQMCLQMYRAALAEASAQDMRETNPRPPVSGWNAARFGGGDVDEGGVR
jgi:hypothetical protein